MYRIRLLSLGLAAAFLTAFAMLAPASALPDRTCSNGDAQALVETLPVAAAMRARGHDHPGILDSFNACQYRVFWDGRTVTFNESDHFVGGVVWFWDYKAAGISRGEAIADIEPLMTESGSRRGGWTAPSENAWSSRSREPRTRG